MAGLDSGEGKVLAHLTEAFFRFFCWVSVALSASRTERERSWQEASRINNLAGHVKCFFARCVDANINMRMAKGVAHMKTIESDLETPSFWQRVFSQSRANGAPYYGEEFAARNWKWPEDTYLQRRLRETKSFQSTDKINLH
jgi:hypothetical protein